MAPSTKPAFTNSAVKPFKEWEDEAKRVKRRAAETKVAESTPAAPDLVTDPVTLEQREAPKPADPDPDGWGKWDAPTKPLTHAQKFEQDVAAGVRAMKADQAAAFERARTARKQDDAESATRRANEAKAEQERHELALANPVQIDWTQASVPAQDSVPGQLLEAIVNGDIGRLTFGPGQLGSLVDAATASGAFGQLGRQQTAGVLLVSREATSLHLDVSMPGHGQRHERVPPATATDLGAAGCKWLTQKLTALQDTPSTRDLPLLVVLVDCEPDELSGLKRLSDELHVAVALSVAGEKPHWEPID